MISKNSINEDYSANDFFEIVEHVPNAIIKADNSGKIKYINKYALELFEYSANETIGRNVIGIIIPAGKIDMNTENIGEYFQNNKTIELENTTKNGKKIWMSWDTRAIKDELSNTRELIFVGTNRTEENKIKGQLINSEERFNRMFSQSSLGIYQTTPEGQIIEINESFAKLFGYRSVEEMMSKINNIPQQLYADPEIREKLFEDLEKEPQKKTVLEIRFIKKGGAVFIGNLHIRKVEDIQSKTTFYEGYVEDITDRKSAELALQYSKNKYKHLVQTLPYGIEEVDLNGYISYCNIPLEKMLGYSSGELIGKHISEISLLKFSHKQDIELLTSAGKEQPNTKRLFDKISTKDGNILDIQVDWNYHYDANKKLIGFIFIISDITEQKAAANALKESETRFRGIYENSTIGIYRTTIEGEFILANPAMCRLFGYDTFEEFKKNNAGNFYLDAKERDSFINEINKKGFIKGFENTGVKKDGSLLFFRESAHTVTNENGDVVYYDGIVEDYTEKKLMEQNLIKAKEDAEKADRLKSAFLANMSHEVRTPMNGIMGFANLLSQPKINDELRTKYTKIIRSRGEDLLRIINDILDISKLEVNQLKLYKKEFSLNELMEQLYEIYNHKLKLFEKKDVEIKLNIGCKDKNYFLSADETRLKQILTNFIDNAFKFTDKGLVELGCELKNDQIYFYVKDTGIGISPNMQKIIFERFRQNDESPTRNYGGNGLGLAICKGLAELMHGTVGVISNEKEGSTFYLNLPSNLIVEKNIAKESKLVQHHWPNKKILLVEDDEISSALIEEYFLQTKALIKVAGDGYSALRIIKDSDDFDLVLLDIGLPDISGLEVAKQLKKKKPNLPIIAQTAFAMKEDEIRCQKAGCDNFLKKPIVKEILFEKVSQYLNKV